MGVLTRRKKQEMGDSTRQSTFLKVVHPRGYVEIFREPITAGEIMRRYPRHCIARPDFFEFPWIVVRPESVLVPGKTFYLVPHRTIDKHLKAKRQQIQSLNLKQDQSSIQYSYYQNHNRRNSPIKSLAGVSPEHQQQDSGYRRHTNHHHHHHHHHHHRSDIVDDKESYCNDRQGQDSDNGSLYKLSFYRSWNKMRRNLHQPHQESYDQLDSELDSPIDTSRSCFSVTRSGQPHVASPEQSEMQRVKSCLSKAESGRKKLNLKVSFASPIVMPGSQRGSPSVQQDGLVLQV